ncbi:MAG: UDP-N-acetylmuramoyl-L-alanine--D-glutamate ligase [Candidatus Omnitrophica bacterium]|nr:UDP-N-acetylmuramoyl-L-alanine--D-glutamate ligase [Candidatus Omnitrophota bacterium]MCF7877026.1 UDP-N-acetylmuramoyl-L-alanine--D-glutamate ligase [Candidatus Omnitrophota bacterium]MCF7892546.1 UDP-N-acetylmuramoyl-L-alanine--D-glutamate ligase [Candidatus Omnitrophota bacterium]
MDIKNMKTICVAGWGKTGIALTRMLLSLGKKVKITEIRERNCFSFQLIKDFQLKGADFEFGGHSEGFVGDADLIVLSPGIDFFNSQLFKIVLKNHLAYCGELEFISYFTEAKIIAITGTNGKTSTAYLTYRLLKKKNKNVYLGGNIGRPFSEFVLNTEKGDLIVLEVSSFQLEAVIKFRPYIAVLLNIKPDHLDRHKSFDNYLKTKMKIFRNQQKDDWAIINKKDNLFKIFSSQIHSKIIHFNDEFPNENLSAAYRIGKIFGFTKTDCLSLFSKCRKLPHRQQLVKVIDQIKFINDSKSTNPASTCFAIKSMQSPIILIAGGKDKGFSYSSLENYARKIKKINLIGQAADKIKNELDNKIKCQKFDSLEDAVSFSSREAAAGDVVLFSPMCSSFDMFANYKKRGQKFIELVGKVC